MSKANPETNMSNARQISDIKLALMLAVATCLGGFGATLLDNVMLDASTARETDVQIVELAIGVLSEKLDQSDEANTAKDKALRIWAVDTLNTAARVKLPNEARAALIDGSSAFDSVQNSLEIIRRRMDEVRGQEPTIQRQGHQRILIQTPSIGSAAEPKEIIGTAGELTFEPIISETDAGQMGKPVQD